MKLGPLKEMDTCLGGLYDIQIFMWYVVDISMQQ